MQRNPFHSMTAACFFKLVLHFSAFYEQFVRWLSGDIAEGKVLIELQLICNPYE